MDPAGAIHCAPTVADPVGAQFIAPLPDASVPAFLTQDSIAMLETEVHLWYIEPETIADPALLAAYDALLTPAERARNRRYVFERHRHQHLVTRALVRTVLTTYHPAVDPREWAFEIGEFGRPEIAAPMVQPMLRFNLSHTDGMVVCLVAGDCQIGVDVEDTARTGYTVEIADRYFSAAEVRELRSWPPERQSERFFDYWTLKEAYIKARGLGLQIPLDQFTMLPSARRPGERAVRPASIAFGPEIEDQPASWQLASLDLTPRHRVALAIRRHGADLGLRIMRTVPLSDKQPARLAETRG
jgi:4'-phosphopantetheinyl transferase